jgi:hypothetical protein
LADTTERVPGVATNGEIAEILEQLSPILDQYPVDLRLISLAAAILITLDNDIDLDDLKDGTGLLISGASSFVAKCMNQTDVDWDTVPASKLN